jgi:hypothetical protein
MRIRRSHSGGNSKRNKSMAVVQDF